MLKCNFILSFQSGLLCSGEEDKCMQCVGLISMTSHLIHFRFSRSPMLVPCCQASLLTLDRILLEGLCPIILKQGKSDKHFKHLNAAKLICTFLHFILYILLSISPPLLSLPRARRSPPSSPLCPAHLKPHLMK